MQKGYPAFIRPIEEAPIKPGIKFGPCALSPGINGCDWIIGEWDGYAWFNQVGEIIIHPRYFALMPDLAALDSLFAGGGSSPVSFDEDGSVVDGAARLRGRLSLS